MNETGLEHWLTAHRDALLGDDAAAGPHLDEALVIEVLERRGRLGDREREHLAICSECRHVTSELGRELLAAAPREEHRPIGSWLRVDRWRSTLLVAAGAAALAALLVIVPMRSGRPGGFDPKGAPASDSASVTLIAVGGDGAEREARDGATLGLNERLGFRYGNPSGERASLTLLGWDGREVHWYYPESPSGPPIALRAGPLSRNLRLPFDIQLAKKHQAGKLEVIAAFDVDPGELAATIRAGRVVQDEAIRVFRLTIAAGEEP